MVRSLFTSTWVCVSVLKPSLEIVTAYIPMGRFCTEYDPLELVCSVISRLVSTLRAFTTASGIMPPVASLTVPVIAPNVCWATAGVGRKGSRQNSPTTSHEKWRITVVRISFLSAVSRSKRAPRGPGRGSWTTYPELTSLILKTAGNQMGTRRQWNKYKFER